MIIGNGQLAQAFIFKDSDDVVIFASGVPNSNCTDETQFDRERNLLLSTLQKYGGKKFVYFSSCALSASEYPQNRYYRHKREMELLIREHSNSYYIFRIPQLFGKLKEHTTIINFFYNKIMKGEPFTVYDQAYRYVIEIGDVAQLVDVYLAVSGPGIICDLANPYRYNVIEIVQVLELLSRKKATYTIIEKYDGYVLDLSNIERFIREHHLSIPFSEGYLYERLKKNFMNY